MKRLSVSLLIILFSGCTAWPPYAVWEQEKEGEAEYAKAISTRKVKVLESQAKLEASKLEALAEIERAKGVAQANKIIGDSLRGNESYLHYLWINNMSNSQKEVVYIPTEANLPILEAGKKR